MAKLTIEELKSALKRLPDWELTRDNEAIHDADGVTQMDIDLAVAMDGYATIMGRR